MADTLNETLNELKDTVMPSLFPPLMHSIEELTKVTLRTGRDYGENFKGLTDQFRGLDVSMKDVTQMLGQSIQTGVDIQGVNKQLIIDVKRLGFNLGSFMSTMGTFEQVLGMNETTTGNLVDATIDFAATFGRNADQLVKVMGSLVEPMARISNAFGATAAAGFAESIVGLGAAMGPMMAERLGPVMSKFITSDPEGFRRAALAGGGMGAMESPEQMVGLAQGVISRIDRLVTPGAPFTAGIAAQMFGLSQGDVNVLRQLAQVNMSQLAMAQEASRIEMAKQQATKLFTDELAELQLELQSALMPLISASTEMISNIFTAFKEVLPKFNNDIINFTTELGDWIRKNVTSENIESGLRAFGEMAKIGIEYFKIAKSFLVENVPIWFDATQNFFLNTLPAFFDNSLAAIRQGISAISTFAVNTTNDITNTISDIKSTIDFIKRGFRTVEEIGLVETNWLGIPRINPDVRDAFSEIERTGINPADFGGFDPRNVRDMELMSPNTSISAHLREEALEDLTNALREYNESVKDGAVTMLELKRVQKATNVILSQRRYADDMDAFFGAQTL